MISLLYSLYSTHLKFKRRYQGWPIQAFCDQYNSNTIMRKILIWQWNSNTIHIILKAIHYNSNTMQTYLSHNTLPIQDQFSRKKQDDIQKTWCLRWLSHIKIILRTKSFSNGYGTAFWDQVLPVLRQNWDSYITFAKQSCSF